MLPQLPRRASTSVRDGTERHTRYRPQLNAYPTRWQSAGILVRLPACAWPTAVLIALGACRVYRPELLDAARVDANADGGNDIGPSDSADASNDGSDAGRDDASEAGGSCDSVLAAGHACVEPLTGHDFGPDDPRPVAARGVAVAAGMRPRVTITDPGSGRVMSYAADGSMPQRVAGTGTLGLAVAGTNAANIALGNPTSVVVLGSGETIFADAVARALFRVRTGGALERFGGFTFIDGPWAIALADAGTMLVAADNHIYSIGIAGAPTPPVSLVGRTCGAACRGFNAVPAAGSATSLNMPTGVDADTQFVYIADSQNCRIRRAARMDAMSPFHTTVFAGSGCDRGGDILAGAGATIPATMAHLGPVGDVRVGADGTVYFTDPDAHCAVLAVDTAGELRVIAGSSLRCGAAGPGGVSLGRLGAVAMNDTRTTLYFVDQQNARVGHIDLPAGTPVIDVNPGAVPGAMTEPGHVRIGGVSGIAVDPAADGPLFFAGATEGRVYRLAGGAVSVFAGGGSARLTAGVPAAQLEPGEIVGLGFGDGRLAVGLRGHQVVAAATGGNLFRIAGTYDQSGVPTLTLESARETLTDPGWPIVRESNLYFSMEGAGPRVFRVAGVAPNATLTPVAGTAALADGGAPTDGGGRAVDTALGRPAGLAFDGSGNLYIADAASRVVWRVTAGGAISIAAGIQGAATPFMDDESDATAAALPSPVAVASNGADVLYILDEERARVRELNLTTNRIRTLAGSGNAGPLQQTGGGDFGDAAMATFARPRAIAFANRRVYVGEWNSGRVRVVRLP